MNEFWTDMLRCDRPHPFGWVCITAPHFAGAGYSAEQVPCGLVPTWWNWTRSARRYRLAFRR